MAVADSLPVTDEVDDLLAAMPAPAAMAGVPAGSGPRQAAGTAPCLRAPCRVAVRLSGPTRVTGHGRRLTTPVDVQLRGTDATERQACHFG